MKLTNTLTMKRKAGMTLLELTVVILVLLSLISILFIGARAWKKGSDRAANILNIRNVQQAVRAHANVRGLQVNDALVSTDIVGANKYIGTVTAPNSEITYGYLAIVPDFGTLYLTQTYTGTGAVDYAPAASLYADW
jgi:type II secretory pathway pseudopilin PulG